MKKAAYILTITLLSIILSGCSIFRAISMVRGGETHVQANEESVIPFDLKGHVILAKVRINDSSRDYTFMMDTAALTVVSKEVANELGLSQDVEIEMKDSTEAKKTVHLTKLNSFAMGGIKAYGISAAILDLDKIRKMTEIRLDGVIGSNFLRLFKVKIDYGKRQVTLYGDTTPISPAPERNLVKIDQAMTMGFAPMAEVNCGETSFEAAIDTGLVSPLSLPSSLFDKVNTEAVVESKGVMGGGAFAKSDKVRLGRLDGIKIGSREVGKVVVSTAEGQKNALIGYALLSNYVITINYPANQMLLVPAEGGRRIDNFFTTGMVLRRDDAGKILVSGVWNGSPADKLGLAAGDEIMSINGKAVSETFLPELNELLYNDGVKAIDLLLNGSERQEELKIGKKYLFPEE